MEPLRSDRLLLRPWTHDDLDDAVRLWGDAGVMAFLGGALDPSAIEERLTREIEYQRKYGYQYWKLIALESGEMVGCCGLRPPESPGVNDDEIVTGFNRIGNRFYPPTGLNHPWYQLINPR